MVQPEQQQPQQAAQQQDQSTEKQRQPVPEPVPNEIIHMLTVVKLPALHSWSLPNRSDSWVLMASIDSRQIPCRLMMDMSISYSTEPCRRHVPDPNGIDVLRCAHWIDKGFDSINRNLLRPLVMFNWKPELAESMKRQPDVGAYIWLNDDNYSGNQAPFLRSELQKCLSSKKIVFVYDCDSAEMFLNGDDDNRNCHLAACSMGERLPDRETFCRLLSIPVQAAFEWHCCRVNRPTTTILEGSMTNRTMIVGQLEWVLTMILNAIAEDLMPRELFLEFFCTDLLIGTIFRRFLLAQRIMQSLGCNVVSIPRIPDCAQHRLWAIWDRLMEMTVVVVSLPRDQPCSIATTFFQLIPENYFKYHPKLLLWALTLSEACPKALKVLAKYWGKVAEDLELQTNILNQVFFLLNWTSEEIRRNAIASLTEIIVKESTAEQFIVYREDINLCANFEAESDPQHITQMLFLQLLFERRSTRNNPIQKRALRATCSELMRHPEAKVRTWSILLATTVSGENNLELSTLRNHFEDFLSDPSPKVRAAALESWLSLYKEQPNHKDICMKRLVTFIGSNSNTFVRLFASKALICLIGTEGIKELIAVCKREVIDANQPGPSKSKSKAKAKQQSKKGSQPATSDNAIARAWRLMGALETDPDPPVAALMTSLVTFVNNRVVELTADGKKKKKKSTADGKEPEFQLPANKPLYERLCRDLLLPDVEIPHRWIVGDRWKTAPLQQAATSAVPNHPLKSFQAQNVPDMVRFGPGRQIVTVCKDVVTWRDCTTEYETHLNTSLKVTSVLVETTPRQSTILLGSNNGSVSMWQFYDDSGPALISAWQGLYGINSPPTTTRVHGISMTLIKGNELYIGGASKYLRTWDLEKEFTLGDISIGTDQAVTCLTSNARFNIAAGLENGNIRLFDLRTEADGKIAVGPRHTSPVRTLSLRPDDQTLVSVSRDGQVYVMDLRKMIPPRVKWSVEWPDADVTIHDRLDVVTFVGNDLLDMYSTEGVKLWSLEAQGPVCVDFHPIENLLAAGFNRDGNGTVMLFGERKGG